MQIIVKLKLESKTKELIMKKVNAVISGDYKDSTVVISWSNISISTGTWGSEVINKNNVQDIDIIEEIFLDKNELAYEIKIKFKSSKESVILVNKEIYEKILDIWPDKKTDRLTELLEQGYKIVGYSSCMMATSGLGSGTMAHNILLQKDIKVQKVTILTNGIKEMGRNSHFFAPHNPI